MPRARIPVWLLLAPLALGSVGCGKFREIRACNGIIEETNSALSEIELLSKQKPRDELRIAKRYGTLATSLATRAQGETPLALAVREYVAFLQATEAAVKAHDAANKVQYGRVPDMRRDLERLLKRERSAASRIEAVCH